MSGYERSDSPESLEHPESWEDSGQIWPEDFSLEEKRFAAEMRELFPIEDEVLPPLYVQTLLDDELHAPLSRGFSRRLTYRVMRRLGLPRAPLAPRRSPLGLLKAAPRALAEPVRRVGTPALAALSLLMALVVGSVYLATPSFAEGLRLLLGQTGAQQLNSYPTNVANAANAEKSATSRTPGAAPSAPMPVSWLGLANGGYSYMGMSLLDQQDWSNGPLLEIQYSLTQPETQTGAATQAANTGAEAATQGGSGLLDIREFQISSAYSAVLLVVQNGSAVKTSVNGQPAVYVDGMWVVTPGGRKTWQSGTRSMLIFERDGVIFWITGDQRDGMSEYPLTQIAAGLTQTTLGTLRPNRLTARFSSTDAEAGLRATLGANSDVLDVIARGGGESTPASKFVTLTLPAPALLN